MAKIILEIDWGHLLIFVRETDVDLSGNNEEVRHPYLDGRNATFIRRPVAKTGSKPTYFTKLLSEEDLFEKLIDFGWKSGGRG